MRASALSAQFGRWGRTCILEYSMRIIHNTSSFTGLLKTKLGLRVGLEFPGSDVGYYRMFVIRERTTPDFRESLERDQREALLNVPWIFR